MVRTIWLQKPDGLKPKGLDGLLSEAKGSGLRTEVKSFEGGSEVNLKGAY